MVWGLGKYERTAQQIAPAAEVVVEQAAVVPGEHVVDLGTGTGNAALLAARAGAVVTGIDPAPRLLEVATTRADEAGLGIEFRGGEAANMPLEDASADAIISVFALIFAPEPSAAIAEVKRVLKPGGRLIYSAWLPGSVIEAAANATRSALGVTGLDPFGWHDGDVVAPLFAAHGLSIEQTTEHEIAFTDESPDSYVANELVNHPLWVAAASALDARADGSKEKLAKDLETIFREGNEDPEAFRFTSSYRVFTVS